MATLTRVVFELPAGPWKTLRVVFGETELHHARRQAAHKAQYTMPAGQDGQLRAEALKYQKQLMGILAEIACQEFLAQLLNSDARLREHWQVCRYDDVRTDDFRSAQGEYDLRVQHRAQPAWVCTVESRSSITHDRDFTAGLRAFDIIGPYSSSAKTGEGDNALYLRPLYRYLDYATVPYQPLRFEELLGQGRVELYLVAGCTQAEMRGQGYFKSMGQSGTRYRAVRIAEARDIIAFARYLRGYFLQCSA